MMKGVAVLVVALCGCNNEPSPDELLNGRPPSASVAVSSRPQLISYGGANACADVEREIENRAVSQMRTQLARSLKWSLQAWEWSHGNWGTVDAGSTAGGGSGGTGTSAGPSAYTTTNTQVGSVDEADIVKNDGTRIFALSGRTLYASLSWPASALARRGSLAFTGVPLEMFLVGDRVVVFSLAVDERAGALPSWCSAINQSYCESAYANATDVTWVDASDLSQLTVVSQTRLLGRYRTSRRIGSALRVVLNSNLNWESGLTLWLSPNTDESKADFAKRYQALADSSEAIIRARSIESWLPQGGAGGPFVDCSEVAVPNVPASIGLTTVATLDLLDPTQVSRQAVLAKVSDVYANQQSLYLAHEHAWWQTDDGAAFTYLYRFDVTQAHQAPLTAAGVVEGTIADQFSLDEHNNVLRLAVTTRAMVDGSLQSSNRVVTMAPQQDQLVELGRTNDLAPGESVMSARFVGDVGYVVTFRQTDPLFTVDLSVPSAPRVVGELKVPGFSTYIHPLDATHLLTIGTYVPETPSSWSERALQLAIFDVSNLSAPQQTFTQKVGSGYSFSEAEWEHKAFTYFADRKLLAIPFFDWSTSTTGDTEGYVSDVRVFSVDTATGFTSRGAIDMRDVLSAGFGSWWSGWSWYWQPMVRRTVIADDFVYAISSGGIRVANVNALATPVATVTFDSSP